MQNLNFDEGYKEFNINGDESRVIRFNPSDIGIIERFNEAKKNITGYQEKLKDIPLKADGNPDVEEKEYETAARLVGETRKFINTQIDYVFANPVSDTVFGMQSPLSSVGGVPLFERFMNCAKPFVEKEIKSESEVQQKRISKYQKVYHK